MDWNALTDGWTAQKTDRLDHGCHSRHFPWGWVQGSCCDGCRQRNGLNAEQALESRWAGSAWCLYPADAWDQSRRVMLSSQ